MLPVLDGLSIPDVSAWPGERPGANTGRLPEAILVPIELPNYSYDTLAILLQGNGRCLAAIDSSTSGIWLERGVATTRRRIEWRRRREGMEESNGD